MTEKEWLEWLSKFYESCINDVRETRKLIEQGITAYEPLKNLTN